MAAFTFINDSSNDVSIETIKCPQKNDGKINIPHGEDRYDTMIIPPKNEIQVKTDCDEICWKYGGDKQWNKTKKKIITVA